MLCAFPYVVRLCTKREKCSGEYSTARARCDDKATGQENVEKFEIKCLEVFHDRGRVGLYVENNGTEGARRPIETTIYRRPVLSIIAPDGNTDRTWRKIILSMARPRADEDSGFETDEQHEIT